MYLSHRISDKIQNPTLKQVLQKAGLGLRKIVFDLEDTEEDVNAKLTSSEFDEDQNTISFPQRKNCGGFELLRCVLNCRVLESIECAMAVKKLKTSVGLGKIYVRPIQRSLSVISIKQEVSSTTSLKETCIYCGKKILIERLKITLRFIFQFSKL